jgi:hypothetical protein
MKTKSGFTHWPTGFGLALLCALGLAAGTTGCLIIPTPHVNSGYARTNINQEVTAQFTPGVTTREDVIARLGEPDAVSPDERQLAYRSEKVVALWIFAAASQGAGGATGGTIYHNRFWSFDFDAQGRLLRIDETGGLGVVQGAHEPDLNRSIPASVAGANWPGGPAWRIYPQSMWYEGVDGFKSKGAMSQPGKLGTLIVTESNLCFMTRSQLANAAPQLDLALAAVTDAHVDRWAFGRRLVVRTAEGVHSFNLTAPDSFWQDTQGMLDVCAYIRSRTGTLPPETRVEPPQ